MVQQQVGASGSRDDKVCVVPSEWRLKVDRDGRCGSTGEELQWSMTANLESFSGYALKSAEQAEVTGQMWLMTSLPNPEEGTRHLKILDRMENVQPDDIVRATRPNGDCVL